MILSFGPSPDPEQLERAKKALKESGLAFESVVCANSTLLVITSTSDHHPSHKFSSLAGVQKVVRLGSRTPLALDSRRPLVEIVANGGRLALGGEEEPVVISGPCSVESEKQLMAVAAQVRAAGAVALRGGAFKPRSSPYDFQGLGLEGLKLLKEAGLAHKMPVVSEIMTAEQMQQAEPYIDVFQIGARNMYNYELLKELGRQRKPVILKRGMSATVDEFLQAAEYILLGGNTQVILCERGIRTFESSTRNTLDLSAVAVLKNICNLPVIVDPSHATGKRELIRPLSRAAIACGADGLMIETHIEPDKSFSDASQAITPALLCEIIGDMTAISSTLRVLDRDSPCAPGAAAQVNERAKIFSGYPRS
jgi:3-deoxy-7-phosphoheptulonate synthase